LVLKIYVFIDLLISEFLKKLRKINNSDARCPKISNWFTY